MQDICRFTIPQGSIIRDEKDPEGTIVPCFNPLLFRYQLVTRTPSVPSFTFHHRNWSPILFFFSLMHFIDLLFISCIIYFIITKRYYPGGCYLLKKKEKLCQIVSSSFNRFLKSTLFCVKKIILFWSLESFSNLDYLVKKKKKKWGRNESFSINDHLRKILNFKLVE